MADAATDLTVLYSPLPVPAPLGEGYKQTPTYSGSFTPAQEAMTKSLSGTADPSVIPPQLPIGSGVPMFAAEDISNVGGVTGAAPVEDTATVIPQLATEKAVEDAYEGQVSEYMQAHEEGSEDSELWRWDTSKEAGMGAARSVKREDRRADRDARKDAGLKGSKKRQMRRAQRKQRKYAWKDFKGKRDLKAQEEAAQLELL